MALGCQALTQLANKFTHLHGTCCFPVAELTQEATAALDPLLAAKYGSLLHAVGKYHYLYDRFGTGHHHNCPF